MAEHLLTRNVMAVLGVQFLAIDVDLINRINADFPGSKFYQQRKADFFFQVMSCLEANDQTPQFESKISTSSSWSNPGMPGIIIRYQFYLTIRFRCTECKKYAVP